MNEMTGDPADLSRVLDPGPQIGPTYAELQTAVANAGDRNAEDFAERVMAGLPRHYSAAEIFYALNGFNEVTVDRRTIGPGAPGR